MTSRERLLSAIELQQPDHLPCTTHHLMPYFLDTYMQGMSKEEFFEHFGMDAIRWVVPHRPDEAAGEYYDPEQGQPGFLESHRVASDNWRIHAEQVPNQEYATTRYSFVTPKGKLSTVLQADEHSTWVVERLVKRNSDIEIIANFATAPKCDVEAVNAEATEFGDRGIIRGHICCFDVFGQPGTWQDAACLFGIEKLILATY